VPSSWHFKIFVSQGALPITQHVRIYNYEPFSVPHLDQQHSMSRFQLLVHRVENGPGWLQHDGLSQAEPTLVSDHIANLHRSGSHLPQPGDPTSGPVVTEYDDVTTNGSISC